MLHPLTSFLEGGFLIGVAFFPGVALSLYGCFLEGVRKYDEAVEAGRLLDHRSQLGALPA